MGRLAARTAGAIFVGSWTLMTIAMMLPTTLPLVGLFRRMTSASDDGTLLAWLLVVGYLVIWAAVGVLCWGGLLVVHAVAPRLPGIAPGLGDAALLLAAGAFQFSALKYRCLERCRSPRSFLMGYWRGRSRSLEALGLGLRHGLFCVGCCWALMLLMFVAGAHALVWMLGLAAVMAIEKNAPWGRRLSAPFGVALLVWGVAVLAGSA